MKRNKNKIIRVCTVSMSIDFFHEIMYSLSQKGYEMAVISSPGKELETLADNGFHCIGLPMERRISPLKDFISLWRMIRVLLKEKPFMVHSMTPKAGLLSMIAAWLTRVPVRVHTFTGLVWPTSTGIKRKILMLTDWITCACATHVIPEGQGVLNDLKEYKITTKQMSILGYGNVKGIDMQRFSRSQFSDVKKDEDIFTFLFVGRIVGDKGINELVEAFAKLNKKYHSTRLVLVGNMETELDPLQQNTLDRISTNQSILAVGPKYGDDLLKEYIKADCFVMPSYREGFPNTVLEAGAMELPCIVTDINGSNEIIIHNKNGLIVPSHTVQPLYDAMEHIITNEDARNNMINNSRHMIDTRFNKNFVQDCLMDFYSKIMS